MRFLRDLKKYSPYIRKSAQATLKAEVSESYLSWLWWILEPLCFMLIYSFIAMIVFNKSVEYFQVFVFIGLTVWNFFSKNINASVKLMRKGRAMVNRIYFPKYILLLRDMLVNGYKMIIALLLTLLLMVVFGAPYTPYMLLSIPYFIMLIIVTFGFGSLLMHFGVFVQDLSNIVTVLLRLVFYMSGVFYDLPSMVPSPWNNLLTRLNPVALAMHGSRNAILYQTGPDWGSLIIWTGIGLIFSVIGIFLIYRYENSYGKVL